MQVTMPRREHVSQTPGAKSAEACQPEVASKHSGYPVGGTSPFGTRKSMPIFFEQAILSLPRILINGGKRGYLVELESAICSRLLGAQPVQCALAE